MPAPRGMTPFFSVVIPTCDRDALLDGAIASVLAQDDADLEVVVVDDAHRAETRALVDRFGDPRLRYMENGRARGGAGARNAGIARSEGIWVAFLDDDDTWVPEKLRKVRQLIQRSTADLALVYAAHQKVDDDHGRTMHVFRPRVRGHAIAQVLYRNCIGGLSNVVIRREVLEAVGGLDERFPSLQDMELYVRIAQRGTFDFVDEVLVKMRRGNASRISTDARKKLEGGQLFAQKYASLLDRSPRLRHRAAARVFAFALAAGDARTAVRNAPWALGGLVFDPANAGFVLRALTRFRSVRSRPSSDRTTAETG